MPDETQTEPGKIAFDAYCAQVGGKTYQGSDIPDWADLGDTVRAGWRAAASAVVAYHESGQ